jgi:hypothetical protein
MRQCAAGLNDAWAMDAAPFPAARLARRSVPCSALRQGAGDDHLGQGRRGEPMIAARRGRRRFRPPEGAL